MRKKIFVLLLCLLSTPTFSFMGDGGAGWAQIPALLNKSGCG